MHHGATAAIFLTTLLVTAASNAARPTASSFAGIDRQPIPSGAIAAMKRRAGNALVVPTWIPPGYRYRRWSYQKGELLVHFYRRSRLLEWGIVSRAGDRDACGKYAQRTFGNGGKKVYYSQAHQGQSAWRCVKGAGGKPVRIGTWDENRLPARALVRMVAAAKPAL